MTAFESMLSNELANHLVHNKKRSRRPTAVVALGNLREIALAADPSYVSLHRGRLLGVRG